MKAFSIAVTALLAILAGPAFAASAANPAKDPAMPTPAATPAATTPASLADLETAETALADLWLRLPYSARRVMFVTRKADIYGGYQQRPSNVFVQGEPLLTYLEPVGYAWKPLAQGVYEFGVTTDFEIRTPAGKILGGQAAFQKVNLKSHYRVREFFVSLTLSIDGLDPGSYVLVYTLHDPIGGRSARVEQPFTLKAN